MRLLLLPSLAFTLLAQQIPSGLNTRTIIEQTKSATVLILAGEGAGRLKAIATGVVISPEGIILTALHSIRGAAEVQVRLPNGEVFDRVELLGIDDRRDVAALKISARGVAALRPGVSSSLAAGDAVFAVTNAGGLTWSASEGILSAVRPAEEVPGAGSGFRILQFSAPVAPGSSGGALVDKTGSLVGIITRSRGAFGFAVPIESVLGLPESGRPVALGSGSFLNLQSKSSEGPPSSAAIAKADPKQLLKLAKSIHLRSKTAFLTVDTLNQAIAREPDWPKLGLLIVNDQRVADLLIEIDRPLFTYIHSYVVIDKRTSVILAAGKVTAIDGTVASRGIAKELVRLLSPPAAPASPTP